MFFKLVFRFMNFYFIYFVKQHSQKKSTAVQENVVLNVDDFAKLQNQCSVKFVLEQRLACSILLSQQWFACSKMLLNLHLLAYVTSRKSL